MPSCDHKFVGSSNCLKCGWDPYEEYERRLAKIVRDSAAIWAKDIEERACKFAYEKTMEKLDTE